MADFQKALAYIKPNEGGFTDDPQDHGGRTMYGITQHTLDVFRITFPSAGFPLDVKYLTWEQAGRIYHDQYWIFEGISDDRVASKLFDVYINLPPAKAIKLFQVSANAVNPDSDLEIDGRLGPKTVRAINGSIPSDFLADLVSELSAYYTSLNQPKFLLGWLKRAARLPPEE